MKKYKVSTHIWLSPRRCKLLVNHILITAFVGKKGYVFHGITYFDEDEWDDIRREILKKISQCPKALEDR